MSYLKRCLSFIFISTVVINSTNGIVFARRAYSYGADTETVTPAPPSVTEVHSRADSPAPKKAASVSKKSAPVKKRLENEDDDYSILNVFAPAPIGGPTGKLKSVHKPVDKNATTAAAASTTATTTNTATTNKK